MHQVGAAALTNYIQVAQSVGLDGMRLLRQAGISADTMADPEARLPAKAVVWLLDRSAERSECEHFTLLLAETRSFASIGPFMLLLERLPNLRDVMRATVAHQRRLTEIYTISFDEVGDTCLIRYDLVPGLWSVQMFDLAVAMAHRMLSGISGDQWRPEAVHLVRKAPEDPSPWRRFFGAPIEFDSTFNGFSASAEVMRRPNPNADETMAANARRLLNLNNSDPVETISERVRRSIGLMMPSGRATIDLIAAQLGMSARSLQRRLEDEGHHYAELLSATRRELAAAYLDHSTHPVTTVASLVGYASASSFTRWFTSEFGQSPQAWRTAHRTGREQGPPPIWRR